MTRAETLASLRSFRADLIEYDVLIKVLWRTNQERWLSAATDDQRNRMEELRSGLGLKYGRVRSAIAEANGGIRTLQSFGMNRGEVFEVAFRDPQGHPLLFAAVDGARGLTDIAVGHFEHLEREDPVTRTSIVYWWRRARGGLARLYGEIKDWAGIIAKLWPK